MPYAGTLQNACCQAALATTPPHCLPPLTSIGHHQHTLGWLPRPRPGPQHTSTPVFTSVTAACLAPSHPIKNSKLESFPHPVVPLSNMTSVGPEEGQGDSPIGNLLCGSWELVQKILENLSYYEVSKLRLVCRIWADVGEMILAKRRPLHYLTIHPHCIPTTHGKVAIGEASPASLLEGFFMHIVSKPRYCLAFCNANWLYRTDIFDHTGRTVPITITEYLHERLPLSCDLGVVSATGIIGTVETAYQGHWLQCARNMNQEILNFLEGRGGGGGWGDVGHRGASQDSSI